MTLLRYQSNTERAAQSAREGARTLSENDHRIVGHRHGAVGATVGSTVEGAERAAEAAVFPIEGYDEMNVEEVSERLDGLSVEELQLVRDYEETTKKRETLLEKMDRKIRHPSHPREVERPLERARAVVPPWPSRLMHTSAWKGNSPKFSAGQSPNIRNSRDARP
jgi:hypothetical protein